MLVIKFNDGKTEKLVLNEKWDRNQLFLDIMKNFLNSINGKEKIISPLIDGCDVLEIALSAKKQIKNYF